MLKDKDVMTDIKFTIPEFRDYDARMVPSRFHDMKLGGTLLLMKTCWTLLLMKPDRTLHLFKIDQTLHLMKPNRTLNVSEP